MNKIIIIIFFCIFLFIPLAIAIDVPPTWGTFASLPDTTPYTNQSFRLICVDLLDNAGIQWIRLYENNSIVMHKNCGGLSTCVDIVPVNRTTKGVRAYFARCLDIGDKTTDSSTINIYYTGILSNASASSANHFQTGYNFTANVTIGAELGLSHYIFSTNASGIWVNRSFSISGTRYHANVSTEIEVAFNKTVCWYFWANDSHAQYNSTDTQCFAVGRPWTIVESTNDVGQYSSIAIDSNDIVHISHYNNTGFNLRYCNNTANTWGCREVDKTNSIGIYSSIAIDSNDIVHISHYDSTGGNLRYCNNTANTWGCRNVDTTNQVGWYTSIAIDSNNIVHISHFNVTGGNLRYCNNTAGTWGCRDVDRTNTVGMYSSIAIDSNSRVHISHYNATGLNLRYCNNTANTWGCREVDKTNDVGQYSSIAIDSNNIVHISHYNVTGTNLRYCNNTANTWGCREVDKTNDVGQYSSIAIDSNDIVHISYYDDTGGNLRYCNNTAGTWGYANIDDVGTDMSVYGRGLAIKKGRLADSTSFSNYIHMSYYNDTKGNLMYARILFVATPQFSNAKNASINYRYENITMNITITDDVAVDGYIFSWNVSGSWVNDSWVNVANAASIKANVSKNTGMAPGKAIAWRYHANDTSNQWSTSDIYILKTTNKINPTITTVASLNNIGRYSSIALGSDNVIHISFYNTTGQNLRYCNNTANTWGCREVDKINDVGSYSSIAIDSNNIVHISHYNTTGANLRYCNNTANTWGCKEVEKTNSIGTYGSLAIDGNNIIHISFRNATGSNLRYCNNTANTWGCKEVEKINEIGSYSSIAIDSNNIVHISHYNTTGANLRYCNNTANTWGCREVDKINDVGSYSSIAIDSNNIAHISHYNATGKNLRYCNNTANTWGCREVDKTNNVGIYSSIAIDSNNYVHITYIDNTNGNLRHCTNPSNSWNCSGIDSTGGSASTVGLGRSVAIKKGRMADSSSFSNYVHISYCNYTKGNLIYATFLISSFPTFSDAKNTTINYRYQNSTMNITISDDVAVDGYIFSWNISGSWVNESWKNVVNAASIKANVSRNITLAPGKAIAWRYYANDSSNNWNASSIYIIKAKEAYVKFSDAKNTTINYRYLNSTMNISFTPSTTVSGYIFSWNMSGSWTNETWKRSSSLKANVSRNITLAPGKAIAWRYYANDSATSNKFNASNIYILKAKEAYVKFSDAKNTTINYRYLNSTMNISFTPSTTVSGYIFSWNMSGSWANETWKRSSSLKANVSRNITLSPGKTIAWRYYANDSATSNKFNASNIYIIRVRNRLPSLAFNYTTGIIIYGSTIGFNASFNKDDDGDYINATFNITMPNGTAIRQIVKKVNRKFCYEETATSNLCGTSGGSYAVSGTWFTQDGNATYDGDWTTLDMAGNLQLTTLYINYTKPPDFSNSSLWQVKSGGATVNNTIPKECWNVNPLQLKIESNALGAAFYTTDYCLNNTGWELIRNESLAGSRAINEEAIWWNITGLNFTWSNIVLSYPYSGAYSWNLFYEDNAPNPKQNATSSGSFEILRNATTLISFNQTKPNLNVYHMNYWTKKIFILNLTTTDYNLSWAILNITFPDGGINKSEGKRELGKNFSARNVVMSFNWTGFYQNGTYKFNYTYKTFSGNKSTPVEFNHTVTHITSHLPMSYYLSPITYVNDTLASTLQLWSNTNTSFEYNISIDLYNISNFNITIRTKDRNWNATNLTKRVNSSVALSIPFTIKPYNSSVELGYYPGNLTLTRTFDSNDWIIPIMISINPPAGNVSVYDSTATVHCNSSTNNACYANLQGAIYGSPMSKSWMINNTGLYPLSNCIPALTDSLPLSMVYWRRSDQSESDAKNSITFGIPVGGSYALTMDIPQATTAGIWLNNYLNFTCDATARGYKVAINPGNMPKVDITITSASKPSAGGGGGGEAAERPAELAAPTRDLRAWGDGICDEGEDKKSPDCKVIFNFDSLVTCLWDPAIPCIYGESWFIQLLIYFIVAIALYTIRGTPKKGRKSFSSFFTESNEYEKTQKENKWY